MEKQKDLSADEIRKEFTNRLDDMMKMFLKEVETDNSAGKEKVNRFLGLKKEAHKLIAIMVRDQN